MEVNKKQLADIFGASIRTIQNWQEQGMPVLRGGGKGNEVLYDSAAVIKWYAERDAEIENEKLRREVEELRQASEADLQPGTIEYERHRLTRAQADAQELKNARDSAEVVETAFCTFVLSRIAGEIASILDGIPLSVQRRFPELENRHVDFLKRDIIKAMNKAAALDELIASEHIAPLQDAVDLEIATEEETSLLEAWKKYRVLLNRVDTSTAPDIEWPTNPVRE
ncbi:terminase small subunit [Escherichia coli O101,9,9a:H9]|uniref:terminase small subunit n=1 Tax=Escherichia coli TaxID=562 RepID=UPI0017B7B94F|nr:terminase small subunit [Escherichia coli]EFH5131409.1 DNA-packaging protein [Escherichia coli]HBA4505085.1 DNA-packaging protein [Escherichia coli]